MNPASCNFFITSAFNPNADIVWSFQYSLTGSNDGSGGFTTFLFNNDTLSAQGGILSSYGCGKWEGLSAIQNNIATVCFDSTGHFSLSGSTFNSGLSTLIPNSLSIRVGNNFSFLTAVSLDDLDVPLILSSVSYETIRCRLADLSEKIIIDIKDKTNNRYRNLLTISTGLSCGVADGYNIGFSYATPILSNDTKTVLFLKNIHVQGSSIVPDRNINNTGNIITDYILQSPLSSHILLSPYEDGFLLNSNP